MEGETGGLVRLEQVIPAAPERVYRAWTDEAQLKRWFAPEGFTIPEVRVDARPGGAFRIRMRAPDGSEYVAFGVFRSLEPPRSLSFSWQWESAPEEDPEETLVTVELSDLGGSTRVTLEHRGLTTAESRKSHSEGWASCLDQLVRLLEEE